MLKSWKSLLLVVTTSIACLAAPLKLMGRYETISLSQIKVNFIKVTNKGKSHKVVSPLGKIL